MPTKKKNLVNDDIYLKLCDIEQKHTTTRWTITTFFLSVSFGIFGISLQGKDAPPVPLYVSQAIAISIYWFTYTLYLRFDHYTKFLRFKLMELENEGRTSLDLQTQWKKFVGKRFRLTATKLIFFFGILYTVAGVTVSVLIK